MHQSSERQNCAHYFGAQRSDTWQAKGSCKLRGKKRGFSGTANDRFFSNFFTDLRPGFW